MRRAVGDGAALQSVKSPRRRCAAFRMPCAQCSCSAVAVLHCAVPYTAQCYIAAVPLQLTGLKTSAAVERREVDEPCPICFEEMDEVAASLQRCVACCSDVSHVAAMCRMLQRCLACCSDVSHAAAMCRMLQRCVACCSDVSHDAAMCRMLQRCVACCSRVQYFGTSHAAVLLQACA